MKLKRRRAHLKVCLVRDCWLSSLTHLLLYHYKGQSSNLDDWLDEKEPILASFEVLPVDSAALESLMDRIGVSTMLISSEGL